MGHAIRVIGLLVFVAAVAGATWGAYELYTPEAAFGLAPVSLELSSNVPAVVSGIQVTLEAKVVNLGSEVQVVNLTLEGIEGTLTPERVTLAERASSIVQVSIDVPANATDAVLVTVVGDVDGHATPITSTVDVPLLPEGDVVAAPLMRELTVAPGGRYALPVLVVSNIGAPANVTVLDPDGVVEDTVFASVPAAGLAGGFITTRAPAALDATGAAQEFVLEVGEGTATATVSLVAAVGDEVAAEGSVVNVDYVGRLEDGTIFDTSVPAIARGPFPKAPMFSARPSYSSFQVNLDPTTPGVITGFFDAILGMRVGELNTAVLSPEQAYGPAELETSLPRTTEIPREESVPRYYRGFAPSDLPPSFDIPNKTVGDVITYTPEVPGVQQTFRFRVDALQNGTVDLERLVEIGETTTFFPPWPNATVVVEVLDEEIVFRTTPPGPNGSFVWDADPQGHQSNWGATTDIASVNDTRIVLTHDPAPGTQYVAATPQGQPTLFEVREVTPDAVLVTYQNPAPLGGQELTFDIYLRSIT